MNVTGSNNISFKGGNPFLHKKIYRNYSFATLLDDRLKIENPKNKISATYNKVNKVNKLVTVFADSLSEQSQFPNQFR